MQRLIVTCSLHEIDAYDYLVDVLQRVGQHPASHTHELTLRLWKQLRSPLHNFYFAHSYLSWECAANENMNRLIRGFCAGRRPVFGTACRFRW